MMLCNHFNRTIFWMGLYDTELSALHAYSEVVSGGICPLPTVKKVEKETTFLGVRFFFCQPL